MKLTQDTYNIPKEVLEEVLDALQNHWFDGDYNNEEVIEAQRSLEAEIEEQEIIANNLAIPAP